VIRTRLAQANASNPDGWAALTDASHRLTRPHLPNGLATKLADAGETMYAVPEPRQLAIRAELVIEATGWFPARPDQLALALGQEPELAGQLPDWLVNLVLDLGRAGLGAEAAMVGDALARVDPDGQAFYHADVAVALAEAGLPQRARARIEANLTRWPEDFWVRVHAGDALAALGELEGARAQFDTALGMAEQADDFEARYEASQRLRQIGRRKSQDERGQPTGQRRQPRRKLSKSQRKRKR
jgi:tetratricopeptide (TPR) repeat protein